MDEDDIGLRHLRVLSLLLEVGSLTRAAQILDTTQSSVSKILAKLRVHFGDPLFVRVGLSLRPTPRAIELAQPLRGLLTASDAMRSSTSSFDPRSSTREFSVLITEVGMIQMVPPLMAHLEKAGARLATQGRSTRFPTIRSAPRSRRGGCRLGHVSRRRGDDAAPAPLFRNLRERGAQGPSANSKPIRPRSLSARTPHHGDLFKHGACRASGTRAGLD